MDQQNPNPAPKHVPTEAEIARLEAEAAAALQRGEAPTAQGPAEAPKEAPAPDFVPYVDDVPEAPAPRPASAEPEAAEDGDDEDYVPGPWEKRVNALSPKQWRLAQIVGGAALGLVTVSLLFVGGEELSTYRMIIAALLALFAPRYLERVLRKDLALARRAMIVAMAVALVAVGGFIALRGGFTPKVAE